IGIVLVFRASGVINFAQGQFGALGASIMAVLFVNNGWSFWAALPIALATIGVAQVILLLQLQLPIIDTNLAFPTPWTDIYTVNDNFTIRGEQIVVLVAVPVIVTILAFLLQRTRFGLAVRSAADNPSGASLSGVRVKAVSTQVWVLAGTLAAVSALIAAPVLNQRTSDIQVALGPDLLLRGLAAALVGGMVSFPLAMLGGVLIGVIEVVVLSNSSTSPGVDTLVIFILLVVLVLLRARSQGADESAWTLTPRTRAARTELLKHPLARIAKFTGFGVLLIAGLLLPQFMNTPSKLN